VPIAAKSRRTLRVNSVKGKRITTTKERCNSSCRARYYLKVALLYVYPVNGGVIF
jgi:hypothetical protein